MAKQSMPNRYKSDSDLQVEISAELAWQKTIQRFEMHSSDKMNLRNSRRRVTFMRNEIQRRNTEKRNGNQ